MSALQEQEGWTWKVDDRVKMSEASMFRPSAVGCICKPPNGYGNTEIIFDDGDVHWVPTCWLRPENFGERAVTYPTREERLIMADEQPRIGDVYAHVMIPRLPGEDDDMAEARVMEALRTAEAVRRLPVGFHIAHELEEQWAVCEWLGPWHASALFCATTESELAAMILADERFAPAGRLGDGTGEDA